jgi:ATP-dependent Clp protease ATP-binding subunit ClpA
VLELALTAASALGEDSAGPEHLLLALVLAREDVAARILSKEGVDPEKVRRVLSGLLGPERPP